MLRFLLPVLLFRLSRYRSILDFVSDSGNPYLVSALVSLSSAASLLCHVPAARCFFSTQSSVVSPLLLSLPPSYILSTFIVHYLFLLSLHSFLVCTASLTLSFLTCSCCRVILFSFKQSLSLSPFLTQPFLFDIFFYPSHITHRSYTHRLLLTPSYCPSFSV